MTLGRPLASTGGTHRLTAVWQPGRTGVGLPGTVPPMRTAAWALGALIASGLSAATLISAFDRHGAWAIAAGVGVALLLGQWAARMWRRAWGEWTTR